MKKKLSFIYFFLFIFSCKSDKKELLVPYNGEILRIEPANLKEEKAENLNGYGADFYPNGNLKSFTYIKNWIPADTVVYFYENGKIKEKGLVKNNMVFGWWTYYHDNGKLNKKIEWFHLRDSTYKNQEIYFDSNEKIKIAPSAYFELQIPDTIQIGKNMARIKNYVSNSNDIDTRFINVIIENKYPKTGKKIDTFTTLTDESKSPFFGIYGEKVGKKIVEGKIEEKTLKTDTINSDSLSLNIVTRYRFFKKEIYVSDNGKKSELSKKLRAEFEKMLKNN